MVRKVIVFAAGMVIAMAALGCGSGVSADDAKLRCDQAKQNDGAACITDAGYAQCVSCQEECGDKCVQLESCPTQFACPK